MDQQSICTPGKCLACYPDSTPQTPDDAATIHALAVLGARLLVAWEASIGVSDWFHRSESVICEHPLANDYPNATPQIAATVARLTNTQEER